MSTHQPNLKISRSDEITRVDVRDSSLIDELAIRRRIDRNEAALHLCAVNRSVMHLMEVTGFHRRFEILPTIKDAASSFS